jgi:hypothetical protein
MAAREPPPRAGTSEARTPARPAAGPRRPEAGYTGIEAACLLLHRRARAAHASGRKTAAAAAEGHRYLSVGCGDLGTAAPMLAVH